jgi:hypothetical protein
MIGWYHQGGTNDITRFTYTWDSVGDMVQSLEEEMHNGVWHSFQRVTYTYDNRGNAVRGIVQAGSNNSFSLQSGKMKMFCNNRKEVNSYYGELCEVKYPGPTDILDEEFTATDFYLSQNYPNPFNGNTIIEFVIPTATAVKIRIYDITGNLVKELLNEHKETGRHNISFDSGALTSGIYFYELQSGGIRLPKKMILLR